MGYQYLLALQPLRIRLITHCTGHRFTSRMRRNLIHIIYRCHWPRSFRIRIFIAKTEIIQNQVFHCIQFIFIRLLFGIFFVLQLCKNSVVLAIIFGHILGLIKWIQKDFAVHSVDVDEDLFYLLIFLALCSHQPLHLLILLCLRHGRPSCCWHSSHMTNASIDIMLVIFDKNIFVLRWANISI